MSNKYTEDDYCDIYTNKICDNCGKCLENEGIDIRAIQIEDIAKTVEENEILEQEYLESKESLLDNEDDSIKDAYDKYIKENNIDLSQEEEYEDAFDHIEFLDEDIFSEDNIEEMTEEIFPGVRKIKKKKKK